MERGLLARVVEAEREILAKIESAKKGCDERLDEARRKSEERIALEKALIQEENERSLQEAEEIAGERAAKILETAGNSAARLRSLSDETLEQIAIKYLNRILPEEDH
jgi:vacuolar-type H+-ATPase subunit H